MEEIGALPAGFDALVEEARSNGYDDGRQGKKYCGQYAALVWSFTDVGDSRLGVAYDAGYAQGRHERFQVAGSGGRGATTGDPERRHHADLVAGVKAAEENGRQRLTWTGPAILVRHGRGWVLNRTLADNQDSVPVTAGRASAYADRVAIWRIRPRVGRVPTASFCGFLEDLAAPNAQHSPSERAPSSQQSAIERALSTITPRLRSAKRDDLFGSPFSPEEIDDWRSHLFLGGAAADADFIKRGLADLEAPEWSGAGPARWNVSHVAALRALLAETTGAGTWSVVVDRILYTAPVYVFEAYRVDWLLHGEPPPKHILPTIRLPFPSTVVLFGADFELEPRQLKQLPTLTGTQARELPLYARCLAWARTRGAGVFGAILFADDAGTPVDSIGWLVRIGQGDGLLRVIVPGSRDRSELAELLINLDVVVSGVGFVPHDVYSAPNQGPSRHQRVTTRRRMTIELYGSPASGEGATGLAPAPLDRVIVIGRRRAVTTVRTEEGNGAPPAPHRRRGHWRHQRVGPRNAWHYELIRIAPTTVRAAKIDDPGRVYRVTV